MKNTIKILQNIILITLASIVVCDCNSYAQDASGALMSVATPPAAPATAVARPRSSGGGGRRGGTPSVQLRDYNASAELMQAAAQTEDFLSVLYSGYDDPSGGLRSEVCSVGIESYLPLDTARDARLATMPATVRVNDRCDPAKFAQFICTQDIYSRRDARIRDNYGSLVRTTLAEDGPSWSGTLRESVRNPDGSVGERTSQVNNRLFFNSVNAVYNIRENRCKTAAIPSDCAHWRAEFERFADSSYRTPQFQQALVRRTSDMYRTAQRELDVVKRNMVAAIRQTYQCPATGESECSAASPEGTIRRNTVEALIANVMRASIVQPTVNSCLGEDDNMAVTRTSSGAVHIHACPRALVSSSLDRASLHGQLARSLGHSLDSCSLGALAINRPDGRRVSLGVLNDNLRGCLAENHLRVPALSATGAAAAAPVRYMGIGREEMGLPQPGSSESVRDQVLNGDSRQSYCGASPTVSRNGVNYDAEQMVRTNVLEAQNWATRALAVGFSSEGVQMSDNQQSQWEAMCQQQNAGASTALTSCMNLMSGRVSAGRTRAAPPSAQYYNLRAAFLPYCRGYRGSASANAGADDLLRLIGQNTELRSLMGCRTPAVNEVAHLDLPTPQPVRARGQRPVRGPVPNQGYCGDSMLAAGMVALGGSVVQPRAVPPEALPGDESAVAVAPAASGSGEERMSPAEFVERDGGSSSSGVSGSERSVSAEAEVPPGVEARVEAEADVAEADVADAVADEVAVAVDTVQTTADPESSEVASDSAPATPVAPVVPAAAPTRLGVPTPIAPPESSSLPGTPIAPPSQSVPITLIDRELPPLEAPPAEISDAHVPPANIRQPDRPQRPVEPVTSPPSPTEHIIKKQSKRK